MTDPSEAQMRAGWDLTEAIRGVIRNSDGGIDDIAILCARAIAAAEERATPKWRPITDKQKDGSRILGMNKFGDVAHTYWSPGNDPDNEDCWWNLQTDDAWNPLFWMPSLPDAPQAPPSHQRANTEG